MSRTWKKLSHHYTNFVQDKKRTASVSATPYSTKFTSVIFRFTAPFLLTITILRSPAFVLACCLPTLGKI